MEITKKRIKILTSGAITVMGFINGPVLTPYFEKLDFIFKLIAGGIDVVEVLDDGSELKLTVENYNTDNNIMFVTAEEPETETEINEQETNEPAVEESTVVEIESENTISITTEEISETVVDEVKESEDTIIIATPDEVKPVVTDEDFKQVTTTSGYNNNRPKNRNNSNNRKK